MIAKQPLHLNPETVALLSEVLDDAWDSLPTATESHDAEERPCRAHAQICS